MFFHVSRKDLGESALFTPKVPESAYISKEGNIPRVCVCPSLFQCLSAMSTDQGLYSMGIIIPCERIKNSIFQPAIYAVIEPQLPFVPPHASDFRKNEEHWFLTPVVMRRVGYVDLLKLTQGKVRRCRNHILLDTTPLQGEGKDILIREAGNKRDYKEPFFG